MKKIKAAIIGVTGYTGEELLKILTKHKNVEISGLYGRSSSDLRALKDIYPHFESLKLNVETLDTKKVADTSDIAFLALPHKVSFDIIPDIVKAGKRVIDLSADFRLNSSTVYEKWYAVQHGAKELLPQAVYGLPELYKEKIKSALLVANPGCYPTTVILGLYPAIKAGLIDTDSIIIDAKSGISGAGRKSVEEYFKNEHPNFRPYNIGGAHRHIPEIEQELSKIPGKEIKVTFTPQIIPVERGMLSTIYANLSKKISTEEVLKLYKKQYEGEAFVRVLEAGKIPDVRGVANTGYCDIGFKIDERTGRLIIVSAIDNLMKGASSQAVHNMNIMFGLNETEGII